VETERVLPTIPHPNIINCV